MKSGTRAGRRTFPRTVLLFTAAFLAAFVMLYRAAPVETLRQVASSRYLVDWLDISRLFIGSALTLVLPNFMVLSLLLRAKYSFLDKVVLSFTSGVCLTPLMGLAFKHLGIETSRVSLLLSYGAIYLPLLAVLFYRRRGSGDKTPADPESGTVPERFINGALLTLAVLMACDLVLRTRGSSVVVLGDEYLHLTMSYESILEGPFFDKLFCFNEFFPNWYPGGFSNLVVFLVTLTGTTLERALRFFPLVIAPIWVVSVYALANRVIGDRRAASLTALLAVGVSGGLNATTIPFLIFFNPWSLGWVLTSTLIILFLDLLEGFDLTHAVLLGLTAGSALLFQPLLLWRLLPFVVPFTIYFFVKRRGLRLHEVWPLVVVVLIASAVVASWALPLYAKYGLWNKLSLPEIRDMYGAAYPDEVKWVAHRLTFSPTLAELAREVVSNVGYLPSILTVAGLGGLAFHRRTPGQVLVIFWFAAMLVGVMFGLTSRPTRLYEYLYFSMLLLSGLGLHYGLSALPRIIRDARAPAAGIIVLLVTFRLFFFVIPKYSVSLKQSNMLRAQSPAATASVDRILQMHGYRRNTSNGLTLFWGVTRNFLVTLNPDFWEIYRRTKGTRGYRRTY